VHRPTPWLLFIFLLLAPATSITAKPVSPAKAALIAQWADLPDYAHLLESGMRFKAPPRLISGTPPNPPDFLQPNTSLFVQVLVASDKKGDVAAARVARSDDPRLDSLAVETIKTWKFAPAEDAIGPVKSLVQLPLQFDGVPAAELSGIAINLGPFVYDARRKEISAPILLTGPAAADVKAARTRVESAVDDTGTELSPESPLFSFSMPFASSAKRARNAVLPISVSLRPPSAGATKLRELNGTLEMVIPGLDPAAMVQVDQLTAKLGRPVTSPALAAAGITIIVMDKQGSARALTDPNDESGARDYLTKVAGQSLTVWKNPANISRMNDRDVALAIHDPHHRLASVEFQTMYGGALAYNRNGWSHYSISVGKRFSIYRLNSKLSDDIKLVCWLVTPKSVATYPLHVVNVPLPAVASAP